MIITLIQLCWRRVTEIEAQRLEETREQREQFLAQVGLLCRTCTAGAVWLRRWLAGRELFLLLSCAHGKPCTTGGGNLHDGTAHACAAPTRGACRSTLRTIRPTLHCPLLQLRAELERQAAEKGVKLNLPPAPGSSSSSNGSSSGSGSGASEQR